MVKIIITINLTLSIPKELKNNVINLDQAIKLQDGFKIPKSMFDGMGIINEIKIEKVGNEIKAHVVYNNTNQCSKNSFGSLNNSPNCKTK